MGKGIATMRNGVLRNGIVLALVLVLAACNPPVRRHGYVPDQKDLDTIVIGEDTRLAVVDRIGRPTSAGLMRQSDWYYVGSTWEQVGWRAPQEIDRQVVAIRFDDEGIVQNVERFGLEDGQVIALSRRVTDSSVKDITFLRQLLGNLGNFLPSQLSGQ